MPFDGFLKEGFKEPSKTLQKMTSRFRELLVLGDRSDMRMSASCRLAVHPAAWAVGDCVPALLDRFSSSAARIVQLSNRMRNIR